MKKAQGLPLNTVIIAILVLLVLVILILIFGGYIRVFTKGAKSCESAGGEACFTSCELGATGGPQISTNYPVGSIFTNVPGTNCDDEGKKCCKLIYKGTGATTR